MSRFLSCSLVVLAVGFASLASSDDAKGDAEKLQGTWQASEAVANGEPIPKEQIPRIKLVFGGEKVTFHLPDGDGKPVDMSFRLDPSKKPKGVDFTVVSGADMGNTVEGIYELNGDMLRVCFAMGKAAKRPTEFAAPKKSGLVVLTLKRTKP